MIPPLLQAQGLAAVMNSAEFVLPLADLGSGAVDTSLARGTGSATFTRATTAWTKLSTGLWASVASGTARSSYIGLTTATSAYGGYFAEGAGTQLVTPTADIRDMTGVGWVATTMTVAKTGTGIDGVVNACTRLTATGATATILHVLVAAASDRTYSAWIRRVTGTGTVKLVQGATKSSDFAASINSATYTQVVLDATVDVTLLGYGIELGTSGDVIEVDFNQFEAGAFATSPMDAAGAVRNADILNYPSAGNVAAPAFTAYTETHFSHPTSSIGLERSIGLSAGASYGSGNGALVGTTNGSAVDAGGNGSSASQIWTNLTVNKFAGAFNTGGTVQTICSNGSVPTTAATLDWTGVGTTTINIGSITTGGAQHIYGMQKGIRIWQRQLPNAVLQAMTV